MVERFLKQTTFTSTEDYNRNLEFLIPDNFNFAYDVMDAWAVEAPEKTALIWASDEGGERIFSFADLKRESDCAASYFQELGIGRGDMVMLILKRKYDCHAGTLQTGCCCHSCNTHAHRPRHCLSQQ